MAAKICMYGANIKFVIWVSKVELRLCYLKIAGPKPA